MSEHLEKALEDSEELDGRIAAKLELLRKLKAEYELLEVRVSALRREDEETTSRRKSELALYDKTLQESHAESKKLATEASALRMEITSEMAKLAQIKDEKGSAIAEKEAALLETKRAEVRLADLAERELTATKRLNDSLSSLLDATKSAEARLASISADVKEKEMFIERADEIARQATAERAAELASREATVEAKEATLAKRIKEIEEREDAVTASLRMVAKRTAWNDDVIQKLKLYKSELELHYKRPFKDLIIE